MSQELLSLRILADFASDALRFELLAPANVIAWADQMIGDAVIPPVWMIDLALADPLDAMEMRVLLRAVPGESDWTLSGRLLNAMTAREWQAGRLTMWQVCGVGWLLYSGALADDDQFQWGFVVSYAGEMLELDLFPGREPELKATIDGKLAPFLKAIALLPA